MTQRENRPGPIRSGIVLLVFQAVVLLIVLVGIDVHHQNTPTSPFYGNRQLPPGIEQNTTERYQDSVNESLQNQYLDYLDYTLSESFPTLLIQNDQLDYLDFLYPSGLILSSILAAIAVWWLWRNEGGLRKNWPAMLSFLLFLICGLSWVIFTDLMRYPPRALPWFFPVLGSMALTFVLFYRKNIWAAALLLPIVATTTIAADRAFLLSSLLYQSP